MLHHTDAKTGKAPVDVILDQAAQKGTGAGRCRIPAAFGVPATGIAEATYARSLGDVERAGRRARNASRVRRKLHYSRPQAFVEDIRLALYASKMVAYSQGIRADSQDSKEFDWNIDLGAMARICARVAIFAPSAGTASRRPTPSATRDLPRSCSPIATSRKKSPADPGIAAIVAFASPDPGVPSCLRLSLCLKTAYKASSFR